MDPAGAGARGGGAGGLSGSGRPALWSKLGARKVRRRPKRSGSLEHLRTFSAGGPLPTAFNAVGHGVHHVDLFAAAALAHAAWFSARQATQGGHSRWPFAFRKIFPPPSGRGPSGVTSGRAAAIREKIPRFPAEGRPPSRSFQHAPGARGRAGGRARRARAGHLRRARSDCAATPAPAAPARLVSTAPK